MGESASLVERAAPERADEAPVVVLVGNPNVGKTSVYNQLTGERAHIGNYPGITVEQRSGPLELAGRGSVTIVDLPGAYSLSARSAEEQIALDALLGRAGLPRPALCVVVVDAGQLSRNLYLVLQLVELELPIVVALNMLDEVATNPPNPAALARFLGVPVVATDGRRGAGIDELKRAMAEELDKPPRAHVRVNYPDALVADAERVVSALPAAWRSTPARDRALALWALASIEPGDELREIPDELRARCESVRREAEPRDLDRELIAARYACIDGALEALYPRLERHPPKRASSERVDRLLLHPVFGFAIFLGSMLVLFQALFSWSDPAIKLIERLVTWLSTALVGLLPPGLLRDLLVEGVLGGVGNVIVFLPQILLLSLMIGLLEDSGYMARVAFLMDRVLRTLGLHGRAFVPMLSGFACAVPAIMATRTMERQRDRLLTMLVIPLMTCSARLPVYTLIIATLFPPSRMFGFVPLQGLLMVSMYVFAIVTTLVVALVLGRTAVKGRRVPLVLELPPYRLPSLRLTLRNMVERALVFLKEAGTVILACTIALWALLAFPRTATPVGPEPHGASVAAVHATSADERLASPSVHPTAPEPARSEGRIEQSYGGRLGKAIEPVFAPLGFDWKIDVGIIGAFAAREVFISTLGLVYGVGDADQQDLPLREKLRHETLGGKPRYTPLVGLSLLVFFALSCQCMSTLAVVRRETHSWRWPAFLFTYMTSLAYLASLLVYQGGRFLGFG
ncbi:MAG TPA: ferrous iron transport protein B [Polyangiaceae bacterium]|nr:ferrous iron transport protein B [Polyangiaceae bacterium]